MAAEAINVWLMQKQNKESLPKNMRIKSRWLEFSVSAVHAVHDFIRLIIQHIQCTSKTRAEAAF
jgi:hypothetical protein